MSNEYRFKDDDPPSDLKPIGWYDFKQLMDSANKVIESETFARNADRRINYTEWEDEELKPLTFILEKDPITRTRTQRAAAIWTKGMANPT